MMSTPRQIRERQEQLRLMAERPMRAPLEAGQGTPPLVTIWLEFELQTLNYNYMVCKQWSGTAAFGASINIARDPELRRSTYDGLTIDHGGDIGELEYTYTGVKERTVEETAGSTTKDQVIIPDYILHSGSLTGSIITAVPTLVVVRNDADDADVECQWKEITQRAWANLEEA